MSNKDHGPDHYEELEIDLREYIMLLWKKKCVIIGLILIAAVGAYFYTVTTTDVQHKATAEVLLMPPRYTEIEVSRMDRETYSNLAKSDDILGRIIEELDLRDDEDELLHPSDIENSLDLSVMVDEDADGEEEASFLMRMEVTRTDSEEASEIANAWAEKFKEDTLDIRRGEIEEIFDVTRKRFEETEENLEEAQEELQEIKEEARLERLSEEKEDYRDSLSEARSEMLSYQEELEQNEAEKEQVAITLAELEENDVWKDEFYRVLEITRDEDDDITDRAIDVINARERLVEAREEYRVDLLEIERDQKKEQLEHLRSRLAELDEREADGQRQVLVELEDEIIEQEAEIEAAGEELEDVETEEGIWLGERTVEEVEEMDPDLRETVENYRRKREELFSFWEEYDLEGKESRMQLFRDLISGREEMLAEKEEELQQVESDYEELVSVLDEEPRVQTLERSLSEDPFWENIFDTEELEVLADLVLEDEEVNPVYQQLREEKTDLQIRLSSLPEQINYLEESLSELEEQKEDLRITLDELIEKEADIESDLAIYEEMYTDHEEDFRDLKREKLEEERKKRALEVRLEMLEEYENPRIKGQQAHYEALIDEMEANIADLNREIESYRDEIELLEQDVDHYQELYEHRAGEYRELKNRYFDLGINIDEAEAMASFYENRKNELEERVEDLENQAWHYEHLKENAEREVTRYEDSYEKLSSQVEEARLAEAEQTADVRFVSEAVPPGRSIGRGTTLNVAIAVVLAGMIGVFGVFFQEFMKNND